MIQPPEYWDALHEIEERHGGPLVSVRGKLEMLGLDFDEEMEKLTGEAAMTTATLIPDIDLSCLCRAGGAVSGWKLRIWG